MSDSCQLFALNISYVKTYFLKRSTKTGTTVSITIGAVEREVGRAPFIKTEKENSSSGIMAMVEEKPSISPSFLITYTKYQDKQHLLFHTATQQFKALQ